MQKFCASARMLLSWMRANALPDAHSTFAHTTVSLSNRVSSILAFISAQGRSAVVANGRLVRLSTPASILEREHVKRTGGAAGGSLEKFAERVESGIERLLNGTLRRGYAGIMQIRKDHANAQADAKANGGVVAPRPPPEEHPSRKKAWQSDVVWDGPTVSELSADDLQLLVSLAAPQVCNCRVDANEA
eukprot:354442-Chlamydomonas_euryale.AAC.1